MLAANGSSVCSSVPRRRLNNDAFRAMLQHNKISPRGRRDNMPPPMAVRRWQKSRRIYVRPRTGPQSAHLWWPAVAKLQATGVPIAQAAAPWDRQTDGSRYSKMPPRADGMKKLFKNPCQESNPLVGVAEWPSAVTVQQIAVVILARELQSTRRQVFPLKTNFPTNIHRENTSDEKYLRSTNSHPEKERQKNYTVSMQYSVKFIRAALH